MVLVPRVLEGGKGDNNLRICVLLPAYNEVAALNSLIEEIKAYGLEIVVVDDGSIDGTAEKAGQSGAVLLRHPRNLGKGQALRTGFKYALDKKFDAVMIMDADGQHLPAEIKNFLEHAKNSDAGIIIGNRMHEPRGMPFIRKLTNMFTSYFISKITGFNIPDSQCGFRLIRSNVLRNINLSTMKYDTESEILLEAAWNNFKIESVPVKSVYANQKSQIQPLIDTIRFWILIGRSFKRRKK